MAWATLAADASFGTVPTITAKIEYDRQRSGADMQYRFRVTLNPMVSASAYYGYAIYLGIVLDGAAVISNQRLKDTTPYHWSTGITYTSGWYTVAGRVTGSTSLSVNIYTSGIRDYTYTYSLTVDPAASTISAADGTLGIAQTITLTRYNASFQHQLYYSTDNGVHRTSIAAVPGTTYNWTPPIDISDAFPDSPSASVMLIAETYSGATYIGATNKTVTMAIPASVRPSVTIELEDDAGAEPTYGYYVQGVSRLRITLAGAGAHGSTIIGYSIAVDGRTYSAQTITTPELTTPGTLTVTASVTDSRGRPGSATVTLTVHAYKAPYVYGVKIRRCSADGTDKPDGAYARMSFSGNVEPLDNQNSAEYTLYYRARGSGSWTSIPVSSVSGQYYPVNASVIFAADPNSAYEGYVEVEDDIQASSSMVQVVPIAFMLVQVTADGTGISFGELATESGVMSVALPLRLKKGLYVPVGGVATLEEDINPATVYGYGAWTRVGQGVGTPYQIHAWTNPDPSVSFPAGTVQLNDLATDELVRIIILWRYHSSYSVQAQPAVLDFRYSAARVMYLTDNNVPQDSYYALSRRVTYAKHGSANMVLTFSEGYDHKTVLNSACIPDTIICEYAPSVYVYRRTA